METRSIVFLIIMIAIAVAGVAAFLIAWSKGFASGAGAGGYAGTGADAGAGADAEKLRAAPWWENERGLSWGKVCLSLAALAEGVLLLVWLTVYLATLPDDATGWGGNERAIYFLVIMAAIAAVGLVAFLIAMITGGASDAARDVGADAGKTPAAPRKEDERALYWGKAFLSLTALAEAVLLLIWLIVHLSYRLVDEPLWKGNTRAVYFLAIMAGIAAVGLVALVIYLLARHAQRPEKEVASPPVVETPSALRMLGLLVPLLSIFLLAWIHLSNAQEYLLITRLIYPAAFAMVLVLLFDKATRSWSVKSSLDAFRDWLFCDLMAFLLLLGYLNLLTVAKAEDYKPLFWDVLHLTLFFIVFWLVDRKVTRIRFLVGYGYLVLLPIQLLIWRGIQEIKPPEEFSWWGGIWPFFLWTVLFFVLEIITLITVRRPDTSVVPLLKDVVYLIGVFVLLIMAS